MTDAERIERLLADMELRRADDVATHAVVVGVEAWAHSIAALATYDWSGAMREWRHGTVCCGAGLALRGYVKAMRLYMRLPGAS